MTTLIDVPRGLKGVAAAETRIGDVRGGEGFYHYGAYNATRLARERTLEEHSATRRAAEMTAAFEAATTRETV